MDWLVPRVLPPVPRACCDGLAAPDLHTEGEDIDASELQTEPGRPGGLYV